ncbi:MAG TPA: redoxin domain-containing protein [Turneriella sp.]|nr:redoxin domain-containing protein [Turneriella sp.]
MKPEKKPMPELEASTWLNSPPLTIEGERGKVVLLYAFQMLCPGCVTHASPQVQKIRNFYDSDILTVIGLHTVFEHHSAMQEESLKAYLYEFKYTYPVAIDAPSNDSPLPRTMTKLGMRGTPSILLIDKQGNLRRHFFGQMEDLYLGTEIGLLLAEG